MIELPESQTLARQVNEILVGKTIMNVTANQSPHKFAWFSGNPEDYHCLLTGKTISGASSFGGIVEIYVGDMRLVFNDGVNLRYYPAGEGLPKKHQLHIEFEDFSSLTGSVQMYGGLLLLGMEEGGKYYEIARHATSPLSEDFDEAYFRSLYTQDDGKLSAKAFLATNQRIPGLGNGVLQDILFNARIHPKRKMNTLSDEEFSSLYRAMKGTLLDMSANGGRDTEKDLFGCSGGYQTILSAKTKDSPCPVCGGAIVREAYLGGNVYYCPTCQVLTK